MTDPAYVRLFFHGMLAIYNDEVIIGIVGCVEPAVRLNVETMHCAGPAGGCYTFNIWFNGQGFKNATDRKKFADLVKTFMALGGEQLQVNVVDKAILEDARKNPDAYRNLVVRVTGFSAYFIYLNPALQDEIMARCRFEV